MTPMYFWCIRKAYATESHDTTEKAGRKEMPTIPTRADNPSGLHQRYIVSKTDGAPVDPRAVYFVLRIDQHDDDPLHIQACRAAARVYAGFVQSSFCESKHLQPVGEQLMALVDDIDPPNTKADKLDGYLQVGIDPTRGEVVVNLDRDRTGHITFSPEQARQLAHLLVGKANDIEGM